MYDVFCFCLNGPCIVNIQLSFMKKITAKQFLEKRFGKESFTVQHIL